MHLYKKPYKALFFIKYIQKVDSFLHKSYTVKIT